MDPDRRFTFFLMSWVVSFLALTAFIGYYVYNQWSALRLPPSWVDATFLGLAFEFIAITWAFLLTNP
jgi:hypothetical protein